MTEEEFDSLYSDEEESSKTAADYRKRLAEAGSREALIERANSLTLEERKQILDKWLADIHKEASSKQISKRRKIL